MRFREMFKSKAYITDNSWGNQSFQIAGRVPDRIANLKNLIIVKVPGTIELLYNDYAKKYENVNIMFEGFLKVKYYTSYWIKTYQINNIVFNKDYIDIVLYFYRESEIKVFDKFNPAIFVYKNKVVGTVMPMES